MLRKIEFLALLMSAVAANAATSGIECAIMVGTRIDAPAEESAIDKCVNDSLAADREMELAASRAKGAASLSKSTEKSTHVFVNEFKIYDTDSAGGVDVGGSFSNPRSTSAIKYLRIKVTPYNAVGDIVKSEIGGESTVWLKITGPIKFDDDERGTYWRAAWYNSTVTCVRIDSLQADFMDKKQISLSGPQLKSALGPSISNDCRPK